MIRNVTDISPDREYWSIVKGIGIFCVIMGHACMWSQQFIYLFHLQLFFFVSGYLYSEKKYGKHPLLNVKNKLRSTWKIYVLLYWIVILLHNVLMKLGLQPLAYHAYTVKETVIQMIRALFGAGSELMLGPAWFLVTIVQASVLLGFIVYLTGMVERFTNTLVKILLQFIIVSALAYYAYPLVLGQIKWFADFQYALIVLPYLWMGYLVRNYYGEIDKVLHLVLGLICALVVYKVSTYEWVDITIGHVFPYMYIIAVFGIYMALCLAKMIRNIPYIGQLCRFMGEKSMTIMIVHFPVLRVIDKVIAVRIYHDTTGELFNHIPVAFPQLWPVYMMLDIPITLLIVWGWSRFMTMAKKNKR